MHYRVKPLLYPYETDCPAWHGYHCRLSIRDIEGIHVTFDEVDLFLTVSNSVLRGALISAVTANCPLSSILARLLFVFILELPV